MALVSDKTLFVHVPKTGGSSVRAMMEAAGIEVWESGPFAVEDHYGLPELCAAHPGIRAGRVAFGFVRHPVAWLASRWAWAVVTHFPEKMRVQPDAAAHWMASCWSDDFPRFVAAYLERAPGVCTQTAFRMLGLWSDRPVDRVCRTELLAADLAAVLTEAGETFDASALCRCPREKVAAGGPLEGRCALPAETKARIMEAEALLCERFGY